MAFKTSKDKKDIDFKKADIVISKGDRYEDIDKIRDIPQPRVRKMLNIPKKLHDAFLTYQYLSKKRDIKITFQGFVENLIEKELKNYMDK